MDRREEVKALWKCCFSDSDAFVDLYFNMRYSEEINRPLIKEGKVISVLQVIPYPMTCYARDVRMEYISGACTHPDFRSHGAMRQLLKETHRRMFDDGISLSTLIPAEPWLHEYYAKSGYATCFYYSETAISLACLETLDLAYEVELCRDATADVYAYFASKMWKRENCVQHTWTDFLVIMADLRLSGGLMFVARQGETITGIAFCVNENAEPVVKELLCDSNVIRDVLFRKILLVYAASKLTYVHAAHGEGLPLGMARVVMVEKMLSLYASTHTKEELYIQVSGDDAIPENNGFYALQQGTCIKKIIPGKVYETYSIESLTRKLFSNDVPYMSLMLN